MDDNKLYHHGTKGMRWGVRRYQNKDGSLTPAGKKRYNRDLDEHDTDWAKKNPNADPNRWAREDLSRTKKVADAGSQLTRDLKNTVNNSNSRSRKKMDLSSMSDQEMRSQINRALLERQYNDMFAPQKTSRGKDFAFKTLEVAGSVLAIGSSALGIALAIKELKG